MLWLPSVVNEKDSRTDPLASACQHVSMASGPRWGISDGQLVMSWLEFDLGDHI